MIDSASKEGNCSKNKVDKVVEVPKSFANQNLAGVNIRQGPLD